MSRKESGTGLSKLERICRSGVVFGIVPEGVRNRAIETLDPRTGGRTGSRPGRSPEPGYRNAVDLQVKGKDCPGRSPEPGYRNPREPARCAHHDQSRKESGTGLSKLSAKSTIWIT